MKRALLFLGFLGSVALVVPACGGGGMGDDDDDDVGDPDAGGGGDDGGGTGEWQTIISRSWTIPAGSEFYRCTKVTVDEEMYINGFRAMSPEGTHHTVLSLSMTPDGADGDYNCGPGDLEHNMLFASGVGTDDLVLPEGTAIRVPAGAQLSLNLHLYNVTDSELVGESGSMVKAIPAAEVQQEAEVVFGGTFFISLSPSQSEQTLTGGCDFDSTQTIVAVWPHMHQLGRHMKVTHNGTVLHDAPFSFEEQVNYPIEPHVVNAGDRVEVECTYLNDTGGTVTFGDSSDSEMCFAGFYRYPADGTGLFDCSDGGGFGFP